MVAVSSPSTEAETKHSLRATANTIKSAEAKAFEAFAHGAE